ncbi:conserved Plasmodium protein, unknown function [Plasmodium relictum]|uniref:FMR1-interacting protein 1 conserved domain-containing protein n=1 Tax=Plasmodium relictum TaxID=85471 RepID=A0A1J1HC84_PLARL|nr:conserved Plasmodium protein, unknown function [Plasmodium relictum]CRH01185.1 conserved Plasmodium protein, unknown function [Plasmodium relictum]
MNKNEYNKRYMSYINTKNYNELSISRKEQNISYQNNNKIMLNDFKINGIKEEELNMKSEYINSYDYLKSDRNELSGSLNLNKGFNKNLNSKEKYMNVQNNEILSNSYFENFVSSYSNKYLNENNNYTYDSNNNKIKNDFRKSGYVISNRSNNIIHKKSKKYNNKLIYSNKKNDTFLKGNNLNISNNQCNIYHQENSINNYSIMDFNNNRTIKRSMNFMNYNTLKTFNNSYLSNNNINENTNNNFNKYLNESIFENKNYISNGIPINHEINANKIIHSFNIKDYSSKSNNINHLNESNKQECISKNNNINYRKINKRNKSMNIFNENIKIEKKNTNENAYSNTKDKVPKFIFCKYCDINIEENKLEDHNKNQHIKCPIDNCNHIYNIDCLEFHLLNHMKNDKNENILNNPKEIEKWINERKKNYPTRSKIINDKNKQVSKIKKKPNCLIEELFFESYCSAIGRNLYYKNELKKSLFIPLLTKLSQNNFRNIYENDYYNISNNKLKGGKKQNRSFSKKQLIDSLNIHKKPPLLYQLMKNEIYLYEKKLMKCIEYITENNFFDDFLDKKNDIIELN